MQTLTLVNDGYVVSADYCEYCGCTLLEYDKVVFEIVDAEPELAFCSKGCARAHERWEDGA
jgi:hypothetical protein